MTDIAIPTREWLDGGTAFDAKAAHDKNYWGKDEACLDDQVGQAGDSLTWQELVDGVISGTMSRVLMLKEASPSSTCDPVVAYAYGGVLQ